MVDQRGPTEGTGTNAPPARPGAITPVALGIIGILLVIAVVLAVLLWQNDDLGIAENPDQTTVGEIHESPDEWIGEQVIVSGEVSQVLTPMAYVLGGEQFADGGELLVIGAPPAAGEVSTVENEVFPQDIIQVSGEVVEFNRAEMEEEYGVEFPAEAFEGREGEPALVGETMGITQRVRGVDADIVDTGTILDDPDEYVGESAAISDTITEVLSERVFIVGDGLIVIDTTEVVAETALVEGGTVEASGEIREFDEADFEEDVSEYEGNPVMHAEIIQVIEGAE